MQASRTKVFKKIEIWSNIVIRWLLGLILPPPGIRDTVAIMESAALVGFWTNVKLFQWEWSSIKNFHQYIFFSGLSLFLLQMYIFQSILLFTLLKFDFIFKIFQNPTSPESWCNFSNPNISQYMENKFKLHKSLYEVFGKVASCIKCSLSNKLQNTNFKNLQAWSLSYKLQNSLFVLFSVKIHNSKSMTSYFEILHINDDKVFRRNTLFIIY